MPANKCSVSSALTHEAFISLALGVVTSQNRVGFIPSNLSHYCAKLQADQMKGLGAAKRLWFSLVRLSGFILQESMSTAIHQEQQSHLILQSKNMGYCYSLPNGFKLSSCAVQTSRSLQQQADKWRAKQRCIYVTSFIVLIFNEEFCKQAFAFFISSLRDLEVSFTF